MTSAVRADARVGSPGTRWLRVTGARVYGYRHSWRGSVASSTLLPLLYLGAFGLGLGTLVERTGGALAGGTAFLSFVAPGLLAASVFQVGLAENMWDARAGVTWFGQLRATVGTPIGTADLTVGLLAWYTLRLLVTIVPYVAAAVLFGAVAPLRAVAMAGPALLLGCGACAAALLVAWAARDEQALALTYRLVIVPAFLLSGAFFPIEALPGWAAAVGQVNPVLHGVELTRAVALGTAPVTDWRTSLAVLVMLPVVGAVLAERAVRRRVRP